jgi:hypothetical protein
LFSGEQSNNYYPENVIASNQGMDYDQTGQSYGPDGSLGCPTPQIGCEYDEAFGLGEIGVEEPDGKDAGTRIFKLGGGQQFPGSVHGKTATSVAKQWIMLANLMQAAGPNLTPQTMAARAPSLGSVGGPGTPHELLRFGNSGGYWTQDVKLIYIDFKRNSAYNGLRGAYVQVGDRIPLGGWRKTADGQPAGVPRRT